jgi:hypothetical protein
VRKDDKADLSLRSVYNYGNYGFTAVFNTSDKVNVTATIDKVCLSPVSSVKPDALLPGPSEKMLLFCTNWALFPGCF